MMREKARAATAFAGLWMLAACANDPRPGNATAPSPTALNAASASSASSAPRPVDPFPDLVARAAREAPGLAELARGELVGPKTLILAPVEADGCLRLFADADARLQDGPQWLASGAPEAGAPAAACVRKGAAISVVIDAKATVHYLLVGSTKGAR